MPETQEIQITCPNCSNVYQAPLRSVIDVGQEPQLREALLTGLLNVVVCPKCQTAIKVETPLIYHDPAAQFLAVYFPSQLNIPEMEKQRMIGGVTQTLIRGLPPDQRKGYLLSPRVFTNQQSLRDAILGTMGISQETIDRQRKKARLIEQFAVMADDPKGLQMLLKGNEGQIDEEFYMILSDLLAQAQATDDQKTAERLRLLEQNLLPLTPFGQRLARQRAAVASLSGLDSPQAFYDRVLKADLDEAEAIAIVARPSLDYEFFQKLTGQIDASRGPERERLVALREKLLEVTNRMDQMANQAIQAKVELLEELANDPSPRSAVRAHVDEIDDLFMEVLDTVTRQARREGNKELLPILQMIYDEALQIIEEDYPPEIQFVNRLLRQPYPEGTREMLQENREAITPELLDVMARMAEEVGRFTDPGSVELAKRLKDIRAQAMLLV